MVYEGRQHQGHYDQSDGAIEYNDMRQMLDRAMKSAGDEMLRADPDQTVKLFGVWEIPADLAGYFQGFYNIASNYATNVISPKTHGLVTHYGKNVIHNKTTLSKVAAVSTVGVNFALKSGNYVISGTEALVNQQKDRLSMARKLAPVLDEIKGNHSLLAFTTVTASQNEMIYAHRRRMDKIAGAQNYENLIDAVINSGGNLLLEVKQFNQMWAGKSPKQIHMEEQKLANQKRRGFEENDPSLDKLKDLGGLFWNGSTPQIAKALKRSNQRKLAKEVSRYSALEMVLELEDQVSSKATASAFQTPNGGSSYPLEEYILRVMIQHQKEMADISPEHTELRDALKEDMIAVTQPLAEAIRNGDMSALELIRLIGEGKIIKNKGRAIATPEEVESYIERDRPKAHKYTRVDSKDFFAQAAYSKDQLKEALKTMGEDDKAAFAAFVPDSILEEAGMGKDEIERAHAKVMDRHSRDMQEAILGAASKSDEELKTEGLAGHEIKQLRKAESLVRQRGEAALKSLQTGPTNANGIEQTLLNLAVPHIQGDKTYFGHLLESGRAAVQQADSRAVAPEVMDALAETSENARFAERESSRREQFDELGAERY